MTFYGSAREKSNNTSVAAPLKPAQNALAAPPKPAQNALAAPLKLAQNALAAPPKATQNALPAPLKHVLSTALARKLPGPVEGDLIVGFVNVDPVIGPEIVDPTVNLVVDPTVNLDDDPTVNLDDDIVEVELEDSEQWKALCNFMLDAIVIEKLCTPLCIDHLKAVVSGSMEFNALRTGNWIGVRSYTTLAIFDGNFKVFTEKVFSFYRFLICHSFLKAL